MKNNVVRFPVEQTQLGKWVATYVKLYRTTGFVVAGGYLKEEVPVQYHDRIIERARLAMGVV